MKTQEQYDMEERIGFRQTLNDLRSLPLSEKKEQYEEILWILKNNLDLFVERAGWIIEGCYGYGAQAIAMEVMENKRMNRCAWLFTVACALEYRLEASWATKLWKNLPAELQIDINGRLTSLMEVAC